MIKVTKTRTDIDGTNLDITVELISLFKALLETSPEVMFATVLAFEDDFDKVLEKTDPKILKLLIPLVEKMKGAMQHE